MSLTPTLTPACTTATWHHWEVISACPWAKSPKPASNIFRNSVNGDPVLPLPHVPDTTVLFSYDRCLSWQQVLQTPTGSGMWPCLSISAAPTLVLTMVISHLDYSSSLLTCIHPHSSPRFHKAQVWFFKNFRSVTNLHLLLEWPQALSALSLPSPLLLTLLSCVLSGPEPLGHLAPAPTPPSVRISLSRSAWAPLPHAQICSHPLWAEPSHPSVDSLPPSLFIPLSQLPFPSHP